MSRASVYVQMHTQSGGIKGLRRLYKYVDQYSQLNHRAINTDLRSGLGVKETDDVRRQTPAGHRLELQASQELGESDCLGSPWTP